MALASMVLVLAQVVQLSAFVVDSIGNWISWCRASWILKALGLYQEEMVMVLNFSHTMDDYIIYYVYIYISIYR